MNKNDIINNIKIITVELEKNGFMINNANLNRFKNYSAGLNMLKDDELMYSIKIWVKYIYEYVLDDIRNDVILKGISEVVPEYNWLKYFVKIDEETRGINKNK